MNQVNQLKRALCIAEMIEDANTTIATLTRDMRNYDNPNPTFDKIRLMLDRSWMENQIKRYSAIKNRLQIWQNAILARLSAFYPLPVHTQGRYCILCPVDALIIRKTA